MSRLISAILLCLLAGSPSFADGLERISDRDKFVEIIKDRSLQIPLFRINLKVYETGQIAGRAWGRDVRGNWQWSDDGYFCRNIFWGKDEIGPNCQLVELNGGSLRFTSDRGSGQFADLRLR